MNTAWEYPRQMRLVKAWQTMIEQQQNSIKQLESQLVELRYLVRLIAEDEEQPSR